MLCKLLFVGQGRALLNRRFFARREELWGSMAATKSRTHPGQAD
jgi:hypothetical protein